jgi:hypothetical protein
VTIHAVRLGAVEPPLALVQDALLFEKQRAGVLRLLRRWFCR